MHKQDAATHRIVEKRRRDRMNNCLADLSQLIPSTYAKKIQGRGRIEKTEIVEMAIKHMKQLQAHTCDNHSNYDKANSCEENLKQYNLGYQEAVSETMRFLVDIEGLYSKSGGCLRLLNHLQNHNDKVVREILFGTTQATTALAVNEGHENVSGKQSMNFETTQKSKKQKIESSTHNNLGSPNSNTPSSKQSHTNEETSIQNYHHNLPEVVPMPFNHASPKSNGQTEDFYKFKKNINNRFTAGLLQESTASENSTSTLYRECCSQKERQYEYDIASKRNNLYESYAPQNEKKQEAQMEMEPSYCKVANDQMDTKNSQFSMYSSQVSQSSSGYNTDDSKKNSSSESSYTSENSPGSSSNNNSSPTSGSDNGTSESDIPIFALHPKGNFYVPLTLNSLSVEPFIQSFDDCTQILHPVNINVNFCCPSLKPEDYLSDCRVHGSCMKKNVYFKKST